MTPLPFSVASRICTDITEVSDVTEIMEMEMEMEVEINDGTEVRDVGAT